MEPKKVAWGYVSRNLGNGREILIATRFKKDDPLRSGELVIPGGGLEGDESYAQAAMSEVYEETGVSTAFCDLIKPSQREFEKPNLKGRIDENGAVILDYIDSRKSYEGFLVHLEPFPKDGRPKENPDSDAREPRYVLLQEALKEQTKFTPACQVLLDLIKEYECDKALGLFIS